MKKITVASNAGFCFGVKRATDSLEAALQNAKRGERIFTLGHLIHNETYNDSLRRRGVCRPGNDIFPQAIKPIRARLLEPLSFSRRRETR